MKTNTNTCCKSVFQNGRSKPTCEHFTKVWIDLINGIERSKESITVGK